MSDPSWGQVFRFAMEYEGEGVEVPNQQARFMDAITDRLVSQGIVAPLRFSMVEQEHVYKHGKDGGRPDRWQLILDVEVGLGSLP